MTSISVIISTFNRAGLVCDAIASVKAQTVPVSEILVVDDASTDNSVAVVEALNDPLVRVIALAENVGQCRARNAGLRQARGQLVAILDSDDRWEPTKLERQLETLALGKDPAKTLVYSQVWQELPDGGRRIAPEHALRADESVGDYLLCGDGLIQQSTFLIATKIAQELLFDERNRRHSDVGFVLRLQAAGGEILMSEGPLAVWTTDAGPNRLSQAKSDKASLEWLALYDHLLPPRERAGFLGRLVAPSLVHSAKWRATRYVWGAVRWRAMSVMEALSVMSRGFLPAPVEARLRVAAYGLRSALVKSA